jgi:hypothetical protein
LKAAPPMKALLDHALSVLRHAMFGVDVEGTVPANLVIFESRDRGT